MKRKYKIIDPKITLAKHQVDAIEFVIKRSETLVNYGTGSGKTFICLESIFRLYAEEKLEKALIVCTKSSLLSFETNIKSTNYSNKNLVIIQSLDDLLELKDDKKIIFLIQYEKLLNIRLIELVRAFKTYKSGLFIDEVHRVKTAGKFTKGGKSKESLTAASLVRLKQSFDYLVGLTATTITSELEDGYRVINFIAPGVLGGLRWFQQNFCVYEEARRYIPKMRKYMTYPKLIRYKNLDKFLKYTKDIMIQYFPKLDYRFHVFSKSMNPNSKRALKYEELAAKTHNNKKDKSIHSSIMPKLQRLIDKSPTKRFLLKQIIERCRKDGLIIYSRTRKGEMLDYIRDICEEAGLEVKVISGSTKKEERQKVIEWGFTGSPKNKCVIGTQAMGQSLNLHFTHNLVYFEIPQGPGQYDQLKGRIGRMFSKWKHYDFWFMLVKNTIDEYWYEKMCSNKEMISNTSDGSAIPDSKLNKFDEKKLKKLRNRKVWRKGVDQGMMFENVDSTPSRISQIKNAKNISNYKNYEH